MEDQEGKGGTEPESGQARIDFGRFKQVDLRVGIVKSAELHPDADRLLVLQVDIGEESPRQLVAGIRSDWDPEEICGRTIIVVSNLEPVTLRGVESQGMMLAVKGVERIIPLGVEGAVTPGTQVT